MPRNTIATTGTRKNAIQTKSPWEETAPTLRSGFFDGSGRLSPSIAFMIASTASSMPPAKSPLRKRGATMSATIRFESTSVSVPCTPRPVCTRILRSCFAITKSTPSSTPLRPSCHASVTRVAKSSIASGPIDGTRSTATCEPRPCSKSRSLASMRSRSGAVSVPVRSTTCPVSFGTGIGSAGGSAANAAAAARIVAAAPSMRRPSTPVIRLPFAYRGCEGGYFLGAAGAAGAGAAAGGVTGALGAGAADGFGAKSTFGGSAIVFSSSTVKLAFVL